MVESKPGRSDTFCNLYRTNRFQSPGLNSRLAFPAFFFKLPSIGEDKNRPLIPDFEILGRIGGGSYGEVFLGRSITGVLRAVKIVRREDFERDKTFEREFEGIKRYEKVSRGHIGLVDVFHVSRNDDEGFYYYVMELADDCEMGPEGFEVEEYKPRTLASDLKTRRQHTIRECVAIGYRLAEALGHLHHAGLTHRDVKPSNIIFVNGEPQLADIGLVARAGQRTFVGTEGYVPPEGPGTSSSDLYSLAMVLYEMATGKDRLEFPELPTNMEIPPTVNRDEWRALNSVICRAGAPDARKRFDTGGAFAAALRGIIVAEDEQVSGLGKILGIAATLIVLLCVGGFFAWGQFKPDADPTDNPRFSANNGTLIENVTDAPKDSVPPGPKEGETLADNSSEPFVGPPIIDPFSEFYPPSHFDVKDGSNVIISDVDTMSTQPPAEPPATSKEVDVEPRPLPPKPVAKYKLFSSPSGAEVWYDGQKIGRTPTAFIEFDTGHVELTLKLEGYHDLSIKRQLKEGRQTELQAELLPDMRPSPGSNWKNSLGIVFKYEPELDMFISESEITSEPFDQFNRDTGRPEATASQAGSAYVPDDSEMLAFCDWMTEADRNRGYLGEDQYFVAQRSGTNGESSAFFCRIDNRFGSVLIDSEPNGADVFSNGKLIGQTPLLRSHERVGQLIYELGSPGYQRAILETEISPNTQTVASVTLKSDGSVVFDQPWENSLNMKFVPFGNLMASTYETRVSDYAAFLATVPEGINRPRTGFSQDPEHPVAGVSADDARAFCRWLTEKERKAGLIQPYHKYRLPKDKEWSAMAGVTDEHGENPGDRDGSVPGKFPWGKEWPPPPGTGNFSDTSAGENGAATIPGYDDKFPKTAPVGMFEPLENGLYDIAGNVWEWVDETYLPTSRNLTARGGGWDVSERENLYVTYRNAVSPTLTRNNPYGFNLYGFRCVLVNENEESE